MRLPLLVPWRQHPPLGTPIDWSHPLAQGLVAYITSDGDHVSGTPLYLSSGDSRTVGGRISISRCAYTNFLPELRSIRQASTAISFCAVISTESYGAFFGIPFRNDDSWSYPYSAYGFGTYDTSGKLRLLISSGSDFLGTANSVTSLVTPDQTFSCYAVSKNASSLSFYKDGKIYESDSNTTSGIAPSFENAAQVALGSHAVKNIGEGIDGIFGPQIIYSRDLTLAELRTINANPYQIFQPVRRFWPVDAGIPCGRLVLSGLAPDFHRAVVADFSGAYDLAVIRTVSGAYSLPVLRDVAGLFLTPGYGRDIGGVHALPGRCTTNFPGGHALPLGVSRDLAGRHAVLDATPVAAETLGRHKLPQASGLARAYTIRLEVSD